MIDATQPFFLSFIIGLLIGIERERSQADGLKSIGMRTFILFSLLGTLAAKVHQPMLTLTLSLFVFAALLISYYLATHKSKKSEDLGITTEMAAAAVFMLGYLTLSDRLLAIIIATAVLIILYGRQRLHQFAIERITAKEIEAALIILISSLGIISFLPNKAIDPWQLFNPQSFGFILLILAGLQFGGYIAIRVFGQRLGMILIGFFGGMVSSTVVFASLSQAKNARHTYSAVIAGVFATIATLISFLMVIAAVSLTLFKCMLGPILAAIACGGLISWLLMKKKDNTSLTLTYPNPLDVKSILKLGFIIMGILLLVGMTKQFLGTKALPITAFITGLFEIHAMAYAIALLFKDHSISLSNGVELLTMVAFAGFVSKFALVWLIAHNRFAVVISMVLMLMVGAGSVGYVFIINHL